MAARRTTLATPMPKDPALVALGDLMRRMREDPTRPMTREQVVVAMGLAPGAQAQLMRMEAGSVAVTYPTLLKWAAVFGAQVRVVVP